MSSGTLKLMGKLEGTADLQVDNGDITISKLR
jgi:hypothetical protein